LSLFCGVYGEGDGPEALAAGLLGSVGGGLPRLVCSGGSHGVRVHAGEARDPVVCPVSGHYLSVEAQGRCGVVGVEEGEADGSPQVDAGYGDVRGQGDVPDAREGGDRGEVGEEPVLPPLAPVDELHLKKRYARGFQGQLPLLEPPEDPLRGLVAGVQLVQVGEDDVVL